MIFTEPHEIRELNSMLDGVPVPVMYYIQLQNGVRIGFINIDTKEEIHTKNFSLATIVGEDTYILSPDVVSPDRPSYLLTYQFDKNEEYLGLTQNVLVNFFRYFKDNGNIILCLARAFPELYWTPGWDPMIKLSTATVDNLLSPTYSININLENGKVHRCAYPPYYDNTPGQIAKRESFVMHCTRGSLNGGTVQFLHPSTRFVLSRPNGAIVNPSWSRNDVLQYLNNPSLPYELLTIYWYPYATFEATVDRELLPRELSSLDLFSNYVICGYTYEETVEIRRRLYRRMVSNLPRQWERQVTNEVK